MVGPHEADHEAAFEVRAFVGGGYEDPVTGSLNASLAQWLIGAGLAGARLRRLPGRRPPARGAAHVRKEGDEIWIGGDVVNVVRGEVESTRIRPCLTCSAALIVVSSGAIADAPSRHTAVVCVSEASGPWTPRHAGH